MNNFKVTEIIDAITIRVDPSWSFIDKNGEEISDNKVRISGLYFAPDQQYIQHILSVLLKDKEVELVNPKIDGMSNEGVPVMSCNVLIDKTDITYYFSSNSAANKQEQVYA